MPDAIDEFRKLLAKNEALRLTVYDDATGETIGPGSVVKGHPTIGYGRALDVNGITEAEADYLRENSIVQVQHYLSGFYTWFNELDDVRQVAVMDLVYNLGARKWSKFRKVIAAFARRDFDVAANELVDSEWFHQVGVRGPLIVAMVRLGVWPAGLE